MSVPLSVSENTCHEIDFPESTYKLLKLREQLVVDHPVNSRLKWEDTALFEFFELYAHFVYNFGAYVSALFVSLVDQDAKAHIDENLPDETGFRAGVKAQWQHHHGELYRHFLISLRQTSAYRRVIDSERSLELDRVSRKISQRFYAGHHEILSDGNDYVTVAAFSSIEGWVSREYAMWREFLGRIGDDMRFVDMRTMDLHCECDIGHSRVLDSIIGDFVNGDERILAAHGVNSGLLRGIALSLGSFDDIAQASSVPK